MTLRESAPMTEDQARLLSPLQLAHLGDTVWELLIRSRLIHRGCNVHHMHQQAVAGVNAAAQAQALTRLEGRLTGAEEDKRVNGGTPMPAIHGPGTRMLRIIRQPRPWRR